jgi:hypothetical protein
VRLPPDLRGSLIAPLANAAGEPYRCIDGPLTATDLAKAAGCKSKDVIRALTAAGKERKYDVRSAPGGATMEMTGDDLPPVGEATRGAVALIVAERMGLGRFGLKQRIAERAANRPPAKPKGKARMSSKSHSWKDAKHGRHVGSEPSGQVVATLTCSRCPATTTVRFRQLCNAEEMDRKFAQQGWSLDPAKCPAHNRRNHCPRPTKETKMPAETATPAPTFSAPTPAAIAAQAKMFSLLQTHFDPDTGVYGSGYTDAKIAEECRLSVELVAGVRKQAFGELKVPTEVAQLTADIEALEALLTETVAPIQTELSALKTRVRECCKKFGG